MAEKRKLHQMSLMESFSQKKGKLTEECSGPTDQADRLLNPISDAQGADETMGICSNVPSSISADEFNNGSVQRETIMENTPVPSSSEMVLPNRDLGRPRTSMHDISHGVGAIKENVSISDDKIEYFIQNRMPANNFCFPGKLYKDRRKASGTTTRRCCREWFDIFDFISYSEAEDGLYCLACVLFPVAAHQGRRADVLITRPDRNWKDAKNDFAEHSTQMYHKDSIGRLKLFMNARNAPHLRLDQILTSGADKTITKNRRFLESIIRCIEYCGRQGIALRGHRDDGNPLKTHADNTRLGNFKALVTLVSRRDEGLREHLDSCGKTASYTSKTTQNDMLDCTAQYIQEKIVEEIKTQPSGDFCGIVADEVTDSSNWEQLGVVVRYLKNDEPVERLIEYVKCANITGETIADLIIQCLTNVGLDVTKCRCQTYDGAGNMAGKEKGAQNQFRMKTGNEKATYFHCASHELNLALSKASKVPEVENMVCLMQSVGLFFKFSAKRQRTLETSIEDYCKNRNKNVNIMKHKLKPLCETRWVERHTAFDDLATLYEPLLDCLESIELNEKHRWDPKSVTEASGLKAQLRSSKFLVSFNVCHYIFGFTKGLSRQLQGTTMDIVKAYDEVNNVTQELEKIRRDGNAEFSMLFSSTCDMAELAQVPVVKPRVVQHQTLRSNVPAESVEEYFRRSIFIPFIDGLIAQLIDRFSGRSKDAIRAMCLTPSNLSKMTDDRTLGAVKSHYRDDLPGPGDFIQEVRLWKCKWASTPVKDLPNTLTDTLKRISEEGVEKLYINIVTVLRIVLTFSATSASVERTNSALRFVKNTYRSTMGEERFNALVLLFVHRDIPLNYKIIIDKYARKFPRRMLFSNPLTE